VPVQQRKTAHCGNLRRRSAIDLITTEPTMLAGITAVIRYIRIQMRNDGTCMPHQIKFEWDRDARPTATKRWDG
jgi:hypothetical protein